MEKIDLWPTKVVADVLFVNQSCKDFFVSLKKFKEEKKGDVGLRKGKYKMK